MTVYNSLISAGNVDLHPDYLNEIFSAAVEESVAMRLGTRLRNMTSSELVLKVNSALPTAYFVGTKGTTQTFPANALKQTTGVEWTDESIYAGEIAVMVPIPNNVFNDANFDILGECKRLLPGAIAKKVDEAILYGTKTSDVPDNWTNGIFVDMPAENKIAVAHTGDIYDDILGDGGVFAQVELDGYDVTGMVGAVSLKGKLRGLRAIDGSGNATGAPIFVQTVQSPAEYSLNGVPILFPKNGAFDPTKTLLIAGEWEKLVYSIRQDVRFDVFTTGVIQDGNGAIQHNLMQEDLTVVRVTFRMGWALPQPAMRITASGTGYPFAAYVP